MFDILVITGPIYLCIAVGYVTTRFGIFARADRQVFGKFVIKIAVPALLCKTLHGEAEVEAILGALADGRLATTRRQCVRGDDWLALAEVLAGTLPK